MCLITTNKFSDVILKFLQLFLPVDNSNKQYQLKKRIIINAKTINM